MRGTSTQESLWVGLDVGSTTVKGVAVDDATDKIVWRDYQRHETKQAEKLLEMLGRLETEAGIRPGHTRVFITGSGALSLAPHIGACFVQEVTAVSLAIEKLHPDAQSAIELGGQDAKVIIFKDDRKTDRKQKILSMNDKCAGGTGAVIDKITAKLGIAPDKLEHQQYRGIRLHPVAGKCGVFAESDINSLQKLGIPTAELMASLFEAIVLQNLTVLTRGHSLRPHVLLLGGPNHFIEGMRQAWQANIPDLWAERGVEFPADTSPESLIYAPPGALYFAALGAIESGKGEEGNVGVYSGCSKLERYVHEDKIKIRNTTGRLGLWSSEHELAEFKASYPQVPFVPATYQPGATVEAFVGIDAGSTSTKAALLSPDGRVLHKTYRLSDGNPIQDTMQMFERLRAHVEEQGARLDVLGLCTTGYAKDILKDVIGADAALVETVAHAESATYFYDRPDVIVDVGGQDIKMIFLRDGRVTDFRLNTQCSAGNGYFLQSTAASFGIPVDEYASVAFEARRMPVFTYGCAVFLQSDIVGFQRQGWGASEILAGLAAVLPKNIWLYVAKIPNVARLGRRFILQGGTQNNLAAVKAQVDYIRERFADTSTEPEIIVHEHCGEAGAIGAAIEAMRLHRQGRRTSFIGLDAIREISYRTTRSEATRCSFCKNRCLRTFIDVKIGDGSDWQPIESPVPLHPGERRLIISTCEKGSVEDVAAMREIKAQIDATRDANPNLVEVAARQVWKAQKPPLKADPPPRKTWSLAARRRARNMRRRAEVRIGIPRVLNMYLYAPLFSAYFESLGLRPENIVYSDATTDDMYRKGAKRGAVDPCFPSKIALAHVHNLLHVKHRSRPLNHIFFPMFDFLVSHVRTKGHNACPTLSVTPETVKAAFTKEDDAFRARGIRYLDPLINLQDRRIFKHQMYETFGPLLGLTMAENDRASDEGFAAFADFEMTMAEHGRRVIQMLEQEGRVGIVVLGRPYHHDSGVNHGILRELQLRGYPILSQSTLPRDEELLALLFHDDLAEGHIGHPLEIHDIWKTTYSTSSANKLWAAKFVARHPNLVALEVSSFKCGHDAPLYTLVEQIIACSETPYFSFKDVDENKSTGSIKIRVETFDYFLKRYREEMLPVLLAMGQRGNGSQPTAAKLTRTGTAART